MVRRRKRDLDDVEQVEDVQQVAGARHRGPWDISERQPGDDPAYVDLGALLVKGKAGLTIQLPTDGEAETIGSVVLITEDAALELRVFAATRSGGLWDEVRDDLIIEVERLKGTSQQVDGPFGPELHVRVPVELPEGEEGFQPSRIIGIEGPRWMLRATFLGEAGLNPVDEGLLMDALQDVIVVRGDEPRIPREPLLLSAPGGADAADDED